ncbi:MAG: hypothetical protein VX519_02890 [Myxococcota bacterium]|nr:hypothetical protein [Myxococcota bacterium]
MNWLLILSAGCFHTESDTPHVEPTFIEITLGEDVSTGSPEAPLPFSSEASEISISVSALDSNADPVDFTGTLTLNVRPGELVGLPWVEMNGSTWEGTVSIKNGFGPTRIWVSDEGDLDVDSTRTPSFAAGVTEPIHFEIPTLSELNTIDDPETNQLDGEFAEIRCEDRDVRVSAVGSNGYWITDMADEPSSYNNLYIYTFSKPDPSIVTGARLNLLTGNDQEYLGTTQFSFPTYEVTDDPIVATPAALEITAEHCDGWRADATGLEPMESALVTLNNATVPTGFAPGNEDYSDYENYGQWPVQVEGASCTFYVSSSAACPHFKPVAGQDLPAIDGMLNQVWDKWILVIRSSDDLPAGFCEDKAGGPPPRLTPRKRPSFTRRSK